MVLSKNKLKKNIFPIIIGLLFFVIGLHIMASKASVSTLSCIREPAGQGQCTVICQKLLSVDKIEIPLSKITGAYVDENYNNKNQTFALMLKTVDGDVNMHNSFTSERSEKVDAASRIESFLNDPQQKEVKAKQDSRFIGFLIGGIFSIVGLGVALGVIMNVYRKL